MVGTDEEDIFITRTDSADDSRDEDIPRARHCESGVNKAVGDISFPFYGSEIHPFYEYIGREGEQRFFDSASMLNRKP